MSSLLLVFAQEKRSVLIIFWILAFLTGNTLYLLYTFNSQQLYNRWAEGRTYLLELGIVESKNRPSCISWGRESIHGIHGPQQIVCAPLMPVESRTICHGVIDDRQRAMVLEPDGNTDPLIFFFFPSPNGFFASLYIRLLLCYRR